MLKALISVLTLNLSCCPWSVTCLKMLAGSLVPSSRVPVQIPRKKLRDWSLDTLRRFVAMSAGLMVPRIALTLKLSEKQDLEAKEFYN